MKRITLAAGLKINCKKQGQGQVQQQTRSVQVRGEGGLCPGIGEVGGSSRILRICPGYCYYKLVVIRCRWSMKEGKESRTTSRLLGRATRRMELPFTNIGEHGR